MGLDFALRTKIMRYCTPVETECDLVYDMEDRVPMLTVDIGNRCHSIIHVVEPIPMMVQGYVPMKFRLTREVANAHAALVNTNFFADLYLKLVRVVNTGDFIGSGGIYVPLSPMPLLRAQELYTTNLGLLSRLNGDEVSMCLAAQVVLPERYDRTYDRPQMETVVFKRSELPVSFPQVEFGVEVPELPISQFIQIFHERGMSRKKIFNMIKRFGIEPVLDTADLLSGRHNTERCTCDVEFAILKTRHDVMIFYDKFTNRPHMPQFTAVSSSARVFGSMLEQYGEDLSMELSAEGIEIYHHVDSMAGAMESIRCPMYEMSDMLSPIQAWKHHAQRHGMRTNTWEGLSGEPKLQNWQRLLIAQAMTNEARDTWTLGFDPRVTQGGYCDT